MSADQTLPTPPASLRPPSADSHGTGAAMSVLAHAALLAALTLGVHWRTNAPDGVEAELWSATPEFAAPRPQTDAEPEPSRPATPPPPPPEPVRAAAPPPPPPVTPTRAERDAEIATERAEKLKLEKERQEAEDQRARDKRQQAERDKKAEAEKDRQAKLKADQLAEKKAQQDAQRKADEADAKRKAEQAAKTQAAADKLAQAQQNAQREKMRQDQIRRMQAQLGGTGAPDSAGTAARTSGPSSSYGGRVAAYIKAQNRGLLTSEVSGNPTAEIEVTLAIDGTIKSSRLVKSSGSPVWDDLAMRAIERTGTLPLNVGGTTPPSMVISLRPN